jgi:hypothetical protein
MKSKNEHIIVRGALVCCISSFRRTKDPLVGHKRNRLTCGLSCGRGYPLKTFNTGKQDF